MRYVWCSTVILALLHASRVTVDAQEIAGSFDQLRVLVKPGDKITVTDDAGREVTGSIAELSPSSLALVAGGQRRSLQATDINTIRQRRSDSLANGAKWGFGVGAGLGLLAGLAMAEAYGESDAGAMVVIGALVYGGIGAGIGVGVDAMNSANQVIYARRTTSAARVSLAPLVSHQRRGVFVSVGL